MRPTPSTTVDESLVSIVVPHFNSNPYSSVFPSSIAKTSYRNFELIIVDDLSTDSSVERITQKFFSDERIRIIRNRVHLGPAASRNEGIRRARGDFIAFIETDMEVDPHWLTEAMKLFRNAQPDVGGIQCKVADINNKRVLQAYGIKIIPQTGCVVSRGMGDPSDRHNTIDEVSSGAVGLVARKSTLEAVRGFDESLVHNIDDVDLGWRIWISGCRIVTCPTAVVYHWTAKPSTIRAISMNSLLSEFHFNKLPFVLAKNYEIGNMLKYLPTCVLFLVTRSLLNLSRGNPTTFKAFVLAFKWELSHLRQLISDRSRVQRTRKFNDDFLFSRIFERGNLFYQFRRDAEVKRLVRSGIFGSESGNVVQS
jgi:GT2 family glycosyltransferase